MDIRCLIIIGCLIISASSNTIFINTGECFGLPENPISFAGAVIEHTPQSGVTTCYLSPSSQENYLSFKFDNLMLKKEGVYCPFVSVNEFSSVRSEIIEEDDPNLRVPMIVPADPKLLFSADCTNYETLVSKVLQTSSPGLKLQLQSDPLNAAANNVAYNLTLTSYILGPSFNCPAGTFRCWNDKSRCIPESLTCDGVNNCFDDSDENNYLCTGRINGIPVPLFAIIIVVSFLALLLIVTTVVFILRKKKLKSKKEEQTWLDMTIRHPQPAAQPLLRTPQSPVTT